MWWPSWYLWAISCCDGCMFVWGPDYYEVWKKLTWINYSKHNYPVSCPRTATIFLDPSQWIEQIHFGSNYRESNKYTAIWASDFFQTFVRNNSSVDWFFRHYCLFEHIRWNNLFTEMLVSGGKNIKSRYRWKNQSIARASTEKLVWLTIINLSI